MTTDIQATADTRAKAVAVVVHNDVKRDARVLKEVRSLSRAGHKVTVFGVSDRPSSSVYEGATIHLSAYRSPGLKRLKDAFIKSRQVQVVSAVIVSTVFAGLLWYDAGLAVMLAALTILLAGFGYIFKGVLLQALLMLYRGYNWNAIARLLERAIESGDYDVVHCHDIIGLVAGSRLKSKRPHIRLIWDAHEIYEQQGKASRIHSAWLRTLIKWHTRDVDAFITINESIKAFYQQQYSLPTALVVMNATVFAGQVVDDGRLRKASHLDAERKILLFQGGFTAHRGIPQLMEAARNLPEPWSIVMMGWGKMEDALKSLARELEKTHGHGKAPFVVLPAASQDELPIWTAGADLGVIPYEDVGLNHLYCTPNKLWEYPNAGVPILATSLVEMEKMLTDWGTGFLLPRDITGRDIIQTLDRISDKDLEEKRAKCMEFSERLSWQVFEANLLKAYDDA